MVAPEVLFTSGVLNLNKIFIGVFAWIDQISFTSTPHEILPSLTLQNKPQTPPISPP